MCTMDRWDVLQWGIQRKLSPKAMNRAHLTSRWLRTIKLKPLSRWYGSSYYTWRVVHNTIACMELGWDHSYYFGYVANSCQCPSKQTAQMWWFHPPSDKWGKVQESLLPGLIDPPVSLCDGPRWACEPVAEGVPLSPPPLFFGRHGRAKCAMRRYDSRGQGELYPNSLFNVINTKHGLNKAFMLDRVLWGEPGVGGPSSVDLCFLLRWQLCSGPACARGTRVHPCCPM